MTRPIILLLLLALGRTISADEPAPAIPAIIRRLGAEKFAEREAAGRELLKLAESGYEPVLKACAKEYRQSTDPEVRHRLRVVMEQVVDKYLFRQPRGFLGVQINNVFIGDGGRVVVNGMEIPSRCIWVGNVLENTAGARAGLQPNDLIVAVNGKQWEGAGPSGFIRHIQAKRPGTEVKLSVVRAGQTNEIAATLGELPEAERERQYTDQRGREFFEEWWRQTIGEEMPVEE